MSEESSGLGEAEELGRQSPEGQAGVACILIDKLGTLKKGMLNFAKYGSTEIFSHLWIDTITTCNRRCRYCPNSTYDRGQKKNEKVLKTQLFHKVIDELSGLGWSGEVAPNFYGEPLLDKRIVELIAYTRTKLPLSSIILFTNGDLLDMDLYKQLTRAGVTNLVVTHHGTGRQANIETILEHRNHHGDDGIRMVYGTAREIARGRMSNRGGLVDLGRGERLVAKGCELPYRKTGIDCDGNVLLCCHDYLSSEKLGNVNEHGLLEIWNSKRYRDLRRDIRKGQYTLEFCKNCAYTTN